jgi:hypothetical protein
MAAINPKPSILLTPTAYDNGLLNSVKPVSGENFFPYSEDFENSDWTKNAGTTITNNYAISPDGTQTAARYLGTGSSGLGDKFTLSAVGHTISFWVKSNNGSNQFCRLIGESSQVSSDILVTTEWNRISYTFTASGLSNKTNGIFRDSSNNDIDILIWGAQLERGSKASTYTPTNGTAIKNGSFDFTRGSSATRVNEQGLIEDVQILSGELVQNGDFEQIGSELVTNGDFATDSDWVKNTGWSISGGAANASSSFDSLAQAGFNFIIEKNYKVTYEVKNYVNGNIRFQFTGGATLSGTTRNSNGIYTQYVKATANHSNFRFKGTNFTGSIDNVSVKEVGQNWEFTDGWSIENGKANVDTSEGTGSFNQLGVLTIGKKYRLSLSAAMTVGRVKFQSDAAGVFIFSSDVSNHEFIASQTTVSFRRFDTTTSGYIDNVSIIEITDDTDLPRIDYTDGTGSLLLEPQSTNLLPYSEDFSQSSWVKTDCSVVSNFGVSPSGETNASKFTFTTTNTQARVQYNLSGLTAGSTYTQSYYIKSLGTDVTLRIGTSAAVAGEFVDIIATSEWQRFQFTGVASSTTEYPRVQNITGTSGVEILVWGAQLEQQSFATSYIPTSGSTVTRDADVCNNSGSSDLINSTEGVLYAEIAALADTNTNKAISISDGTLNNRVVLRINSDVLTSIVQSNGGYSMFKSTTISGITNYNKFAIKFKENDFEVWVNGSSVAVDTTGNSPIGLNTIEFEEANGSNDFYGKVKSVAVFKEALTDEELTALTT